MSTKVLQQKFFSNTSATKTKILSPASEKQNLSNLPLFFILANIFGGSIEQKIIEFFQDWYELVWAKVGYLGEKWSYWEKDKKGASKKILQIKALEGN